jgi:hypothetical protein
VKVTRTIAAGVFLGWACQGAVAVPPVIDRPTPPPCCADGQVYSRSATFGVYETRWRRWPLDRAERIPGQKITPAPAELQRDVQPFERPPVEQEDRRAPLPTAPTGEQPQPGAPVQPGEGPRTQGGPAGPQGAPPPTAPGAQPGAAPAYPPPVPPQTAPLTPPSTPSSPSGTGTPLFKNIPADSPLNRSGGPTSDIDPPPSLPFGAGSMAPQEPVRETHQPAFLPMPVATSQPVVKQAIASNDDPPPGPPVSLASYEN